MDLTCRLSGIQRNWDAYCVVVAKVCLMTFRGMYPNKRWHIYRICRKDKNILAVFVLFKSTVLLVPQAKSHILKQYY
jgi:hypothetical protein